jgi:O-acetylserine/cysteine efflux transporter
MTPGPRSIAPRDVLLTVAITLVWGVNFIAAKWVVVEIPPLMVSGLRYVVAVLPAVFFIRPPKVAPRLLIAYGLSVGVGQFAFLFTAIKLGMPVGLASLVVQVQAFFSIGLAMLFLGDRPRLTSLAGALVAFAGIGVIALDRLESTVLVPLLLTLGAAASWGVGNIFAKKMGEVDMLGVVVWSALVPPLPLFALSYVIEGPEAWPIMFSHLSWVGIGSLLFIGWASTVFGYAAWNYVLSRYPTSTIAPFSLLVPVFGIASSAIILGERITGFELAGSGVVFAGLLLNVFGPRLLRQAAPA